MFKTYPRKSLLGSRVRADTFLEHLDFRETIIVTVSFVNVQIE